MEALPVILSSMALTTIAIVLYGVIKHRTNRGAGHCPECGHQLPAFRRPTNARQMMWGGWTCPHCDAELDRSANVLRAGRPEAMVAVGGLDEVDADAGQGGLTQSAATAGGLELEHEVALDFSEDASQEEHEHEEVADTMRGRR